MHQVLRRRWKAGAVRLVLHGLFIKGALQIFFAKHSCIFPLHSWVMDEEHETVCGGGFIIIAFTLNSMIMRYSNFGITLAVVVGGYVLGALCLSVLRFLC